MPEKKQTTKFQGARSICIKKFEPFTKEFGICIKEQMAKNPKPGTPEGFKAGMGGQKIRSKGLGRGLGRGRGAGPLGVPIGKRVKRYT